MRGIELTAPMRASSPALRLPLQGSRFVGGACSSPETVAQPPPAPPVNWASFEPHAAPDAGANAPTEKERALAEAYVTALASPGFAQLAPLVDDDAHFTFPGLDDAHGRNPVVHAHDVLLGAFDQRRFVATRVWRTASEQTVAWTMTGVQARDWMRVTVDAQKPVDDRRRLRSSRRRTTGRSPIFACTSTSPP